MDKQNPNEEISLKELITKIKEWFSYLLSNWKMILIAGIIGAAFGLAYSWSKKPIYIASMSFALEDEKSGGGMSGAAGLASQFGLDLGASGGGIFSGANLMELFKSRSMVERTLLKPVNLDYKSISFAEMYIQNKPWRKNWENNGKLKNIHFLPNAKRKYFTRVHDSILGVIYNDLIAGGLSVYQKDKKISIINIDVSSSNELFAKLFTDALANEVSDFYILTKSKKARINMSILEKQTDSIRRELNGAITGVAIANDVTFNLNPALNIQRVPSAKRQVDVQANTVILTELVKQFELAKVNLRKETPLIQVIDRPILPLRQEKFGKAKGIIIGVLLACFLTLFWLIIRRLLKQLE
ncbi:lipopolysaccharide biosynthesis protein [Flavobacterium sp. LB3R33]|uniref:lipopolysaccharide biosynthesis protein n=1 Tax=Flavobacterium sp. LB3R33 TaxID=3401721 RepID=UPI003AAB5FB3